MTPKGSARILDLRKASAEYGPSYGALYALIQKGVLPVVKLPGHRRLFVLRADLDRLIEQRTEVLR
jgi:non-ribosomal peptide synthetase component E (peptide arylation enzyme)